MAVAMGESFAQKLSTFRLLLHDIGSDSGISVRLYTECNISIIRDLTSCVQVTENRHVMHVTSPEPWYRGVANATAA